MTNNPTLPKGLTEACQRFYRAFDHMPEQIYVNWHRKVHLPPYLTVPLFPNLSLVEALAKADSEPPMFTRSFVNVPFTAASHKSGLEWEEFALYSAKMGKVKPEDLEPSAELVKLMLQAKGYKALISEAHSIDAYDVFYIFNGEKFASWAISKIHYNVADLEIIKAEIDFALNKFIT